jgi:hypothetical protein
MPDKRGLPNLHFGAVAEIRTGLVWTDPEGVTHGELQFTSYSDITFHSVQHVRDAMAVLAQLAGAMDAEAARAAAAKENLDA